MIGDALPASAGRWDAPPRQPVDWKIVPVGLVAVIASFLLSVVIAEFTLGAWD
ncbi:hypothetical protein [Streptomyces tendae]|uniref:hypothetical protein n=1 Tax=Streptomyces tendae TaxID=1932 RepID=UPI003691E003